MSEGESKDFDQSTCFLGEYGRFQLVMMVLLSVSAVPCGYMGLLVVFVSDTPAHRCRGTLNQTHGGGSIWTGPDSCSRYTSNGTDSNATEACVDGWVFSTDRYTATTVTEWGLVCEHAWKVPVSTSCFFVGVLVGSFICGDLSDRFGRKPVFFLTMALQTLTSLVQAASVNWLMFCVLNGLRGLGQVSNYITALVLGSEMLGRSARLSFAMLGHSLGFGVGYVLLALFAFLLRGWRSLLVAAALPGFLFIPAWWVIPESPRWLLQKGRVKEAELVVRRAARWNGVAAPEVIFRAAERTDLLGSGVEERQSYTYADLFRSRNLRNTTLLGVYIWMSVAMVFYGLSLNTSNLEGNAYLNCLISALSDIVVYVATWLLVNRLPRPTLLFCTLTFCGVTLLVIKLVPEDMPAVLQALALVGKMGVSAAYCFVYVLFTELMPTVVRNMGLGLTSTAARIGTIICPYVLYAGVYSKILPYVIFGSVSIVAGVVSMFLPDTRNCKLPNLVSQTRPVRSVCRRKETPPESEPAEASSYKPDHKQTM